LCLGGLPIGGTATMLEPALIDMEGGEVNRYGSVGPFAKILPGGSAVMGEGYVGITTRMETSTVVQEAWGGALEWTFSEWEDHPTRGWVARMHRDFQRQGNPVGYYAPGQDPVPEGNTLVLAHADETRPEISEKPLLNDIIYEVDWAGNADLVWNPLDHFDDFGLDPEIRAEMYALGGDLLHLTSMSRLGENPWHPGDDRFHPMNIIIGSAGANFMAIIDHQTGGVVWRVGPDYSPGTAGADIGPLINMHHAHMVPAGLPGEGNVLVFDNGGGEGFSGPGGEWSKYGRDYSRVVEFDPITYQIVWEFSPAHGDPLPNSLQGLGGAQRLPNGNTLITSGFTGFVLELTPDKQVVWEYYNSYARIFRLIYRAYRVPPEWIPGNQAGYDPWE
jgi:hypothetical protein